MGVTVSCVAELDEVVAGGRGVAAVAMVNDGRLGRLAVIFRVEPGACAVLRQLQTGHLVRLAGLGRLVGFGLPALKPILVLDSVRVEPAFDLRVALQRRLGGRK